MAKDNKYISDQGLVEKDNVFVRGHVIVICTLISVALITLGVLAVIS